MLYHLGCRGPQSTQSYGSDTFKEFKEPDKFSQNNTLCSPLVCVYWCWAAVQPPCSKCSLSIHKIHSLGQLAATQCWKALPRVDVLCQCTFQPGTGPGAFPWVSEGTVSSVWWPSAGTKHRSSWNGCLQRGHMALCLAQGWMQAQQSPWRQKGTQAECSTSSRERGHWWAPPPCSCRSGSMLPSAMSCPERRAKCWSFSGVRRRGAEKSTESCGEAHMDLLSNSPTFKLPGANCGGTWEESWSLPAQKALCSSPDTSWISTGHVPSGGV